MKLKPAKAQITQKPAVEIVPGDHIPDQFGFIHEVAGARIQHGQISITLSDGQTHTYRPATTLYCVQFFGG